MIAERAAGLMALIWAIHCTTSIPPRCNNKCDRHAVPMINARTTRSRPLADRAAVTSRTDRIAIAIHVTGHAFANTRRTYRILVVPDITSRSQARSGALQEINDRLREQARIGRRSTSPHAGKGDQRPA